MLCILYSCFPVSFDHLLDIRSNFGSVANMAQKGGPGPAVALRGKVRLICDPSISVADLMTPISSFVALAGQTDLYRIIMPPRGTNHKSNPEPHWLASLKDLMLDIEKVATNLMMPSKKTKLALDRLLKDKIIENSGKKADQDYIDDIEDILLSACRAFRDLKNNRNQLWDRVMKKATHNTLSNSLCNIFLYTANNNSVIIYFFHISLCFT